jgi:hypothetical protein
MRTNTVFIPSPLASSLCTLFGALTMNRPEKLFNLVFAGTLLLVFLARTTCGQERLDGQSIFVHESRVPLLEGPHSPIELPPEEQQLNGLPLEPPWEIIYGIFTSQEQYESIVLPGDDGICCGGLFFPFPIADIEIDWNNELLAYAIIPYHTNGLSFSSYDPPLNGIGTLKLELSFIIPDRGNRFPSAINTIPRNGLKYVNFVVDELDPFPDPQFQPVLLGTLAVPEPTSILLILFASLVGGLRRGRMPTR